MSHLMPCRQVSLHHCICILYIGECEKYLTHPLPHKRIIHYAILPLLPEMTGDPLESFLGSLASLPLVTDALFWFSEITDVEVPKQQATSEGVGVARAELKV